MTGSTREDGIGARVAVVGLAVEAFFAEDDATLFAVPGFDGRTRSRAASTTVVSRPAAASYVEVASALMEREEPYWNSPTSSAHAMATSATPAMTRRLDTTCGFTSFDDVSSFCRCRYKARMSWVDSESRGGGGRSIGVCSWRIESVHNHLRAAPRTSQAEVPSLSDIPRKSATPCAISCSPPASDRRRLRC